MHGRALPHHPRFGEAAAARRGSPRARGEPGQRLAGDPAHHGRRDITRGHHERPSPRVDAPMKPPKPLRIEDAHVGPPTENGVSIGRLFEERLEEHVGRGGGVLILVFRDLLQDHASLRLDLGLVKRGMKHALEQHL